MVDRVQERFLKNVGISEEDALMYFGLAPLSTRRDIAMLGLIHRTVVGQGSPHFRKHFKPHRADKCDRTGRWWKVEEPRGTLSPLMKRSAIGLVKVYNQLPAKVANSPTVKEFQKRLQAEVKAAANSGQDHWENKFSPRSIRQTAPAGNS